MLKASKLNAQMYNSQGNEAHTQHAGLTDGYRIMSDKTTQGSHLQLCNNTTDPVFMAVGLRDF